jgi:hypothetical protein
VAGRLPRARPDPRVAPKEPNAGAGVLTGAAAAGGAGATSAGAGAGADKSAGASFGVPDFSGSDMCVFVYVRRLTAGSSFARSGGGHGTGHVW